MGSDESLPAAAPDRWAVFEPVDADTFTCPVCRLGQPLTNDCCARCAADLSLLAATLREAAARQEQLYRDLAAGRAAEALTQIEALADLTGPTSELALLRRVVRRGLVPVELLGQQLWHDPLAPAPRRRWRWPWRRD
ncbi:MAG: hypothetical protein IT204_20180 [Fimbriimonadaceae bacterium]|nr:hypothetical protein [Fimbriimonadaceae bacterium]